VPRDKITDAIQGPPNYAKAKTAGFPFAIFALTLIRINAFGPDMFQKGAVAGVPDGATRPFPRQ
jgi:hypothetical protein